MRYCDSHYNTKLNFELWIKITSLPGALPVRAEVPALDALLGRFPRSPGRLVDNEGVAPFFGYFLFGGHLLRASVVSRINE
jgi:hypothetical protein